MENCLPTSLFQKGLSEKMLNLKRLSRRDQPAQRLWHNPFEKRLDRKQQQRRNQRDQTEQRLRSNRI